MDHLVFLAQEHMESAQVSLRTLSGQLHQNVFTFKNGLSNTCLNTLNHFKDSNFGTHFHHWLDKIKTALLTFKLADLYEKCLHFFLTQVTHTHIYVGGMCFIFGTMVGVGLGFRIRDSEVAPQKMRAVVATTFSGLESISVVEDLPTPRIISSDQLMVQVKAAGVDYLDVKVSQGYGRVLRSHLNKYNPNFCGAVPVVLGRDCSGVVVSVGKGVTKVEPGDEVWLAVPVHHQGTLSEYIVVSECFVSVKPRQLSHECAASLPYDLMRAWDALVTQAGLGEMSTAGKRVLIHAGGTGVGVVAVQLVRAWGGHVTTTVHSRTEALARHLGADDVITYDTDNFEKELSARQRYDVIFNPLGPIVSEKSLLEFCTSGGSVVTSDHPPLPSDSYGIIVGMLYHVFMRTSYYFTKCPWVKGVRLGSLEISGEVLDRVSPLVATGQLQAVVDKAYSAMDGEMAFQHITRDQTNNGGKTVIKFRARPIANRHDEFIPSRIN